jgi:hypothetical protein
MEDVTIEDLLNFDEGAAAGMDETNNGSDGDDEEDDADFLELQQKLTGGNNTESITPQEEKEPSPVTIDVNGSNGINSDIMTDIPLETVEPDEEPSQLSPEEEMLKLQQKNAQLQQQLQELQLANDIVDPNAPSTDDLLQQISDLETQVASLQQEKSQMENPTSTGVSTLLQRIQALETMNRRLEDGNSQLQEQVQDSQQTNGRHLETIAKLQNNSTPTTPDEPEVDPVVPSSKPKPELPKSSAWQHAGHLLQIHELESTVQNLQERIMGLVEEKLELQLTVDRMEHDLKQQSSTPTLFAPKRGSWFSSTPTATTMKPPLEDANIISNSSGEDTNNPSPTSQTDLLKVALAKKKKRESGTRFGFLGSSSSSGDNNDTMNSGSNHKDTSGHSKKDEDDDVIDVELYKKLAEHQARYGAESLGIQTSHDDFDKAINEFESSAHITSSSSKTETTTTTPPKSSSIAGWFTSKGAVVEEEDSQFTSSPIRQSQTISKFPPPMAMDTLPSMLGMGSKTNSRDDLLEDETVDFGGGSKTFSSGGHSKDEERVALFAPIAEVNKVMAAHKTANLTKTRKDNPVGLGQTIDQSNLLGHYVTKKKDNTGTLNYLTSMIYGGEDADYDDGEDADELLREELNKKRKEEIKAKDPYSAPYKDDPSAEAFAAAPKTTNIAAGEKSAIAATTVKPKTLLSGGL